MSRATALGSPLNRECHPERSEGSLSPAKVEYLRRLDGKQVILSTENVILSVAKDLCPQRARPFPFAALRVTRFGNLSERLWGLPPPCRPR